MAGCAAHHGELVGASRCALVEVFGQRAGLERTSRSLRRAWVGQVRVVARGQPSDAKDAGHDGRQGVVKARGYCMQWSEMEGSTANWHGSPKAVRSRQGPILMTTFNIYYFLRVPISKYRHIDG